MAEESLDQSLFEKFKSEDEDRRKIWTLRSLERTRYLVLPVGEKLRFRLFATGLKLRQNRLIGVIPSSLETIKRWIFARDEEKDQLLKETQKKTNPYNTYIGQRFSSISEFLSSDNSMARVKELFFLGRAIYVLESKAVHSIRDKQLLDHILVDQDYNELWENEYRKEGLGNITTVVKWTTDRLHEFSSSSIPPMASESRSHREQTGVEHAPTRADEFHVTRDWEKFGFYLEGWFFERTLRSVTNGKRASRVIHLYSRVDDNGNLQQRTVVKVTGFHDDYSADVQTAHEFWHLKHLSSVQADCFLQCYGYSVRRRKNPMSGPTHLGYGYLEYAPYGDLYDLADMNKLRGTNTTEFFIWYVFDTLARALLTLSWGKGLPHDYEIPENCLGMSNEELRLYGKAEDWYTVINTDIKTDNVVLAESGTRYPYPTPKMIDLGLIHKAVYPEPHDAMFDFRTQRSALGTPGSQPPEQVFITGSPVDQRVKAIAHKNTIGIHSEIFNVGLIIWNLMNKKRIRWEALNGTYKYENLTKRKDIRYQGMYSSLLYDLTEECIRMEVNKRPTLAQLITRTRQGLERSRHAFPGADPTGKSWEELQPALKIPLKRSLRTGDFMGERYRRLRRHVPEQGGKPPLRPPVHADRPATLLDPSPFGPISPPIHLTPPIDPILLTPPPPIVSPITPPPQIPLIPRPPPRPLIPRPPPPPPIIPRSPPPPPVVTALAAPIVNIHVPRIYRTMRKKAILYEHFVQRALDEPANAKRWQRPVGKINNTLTSLINVLAKDDPTGQKGEAEVDRIRARLGKYPP